jgi:predicted ArsR family transcriptional regulator
MVDMDLFDRSILAVLKDGKPRNFKQILSQVGFSPNTLRLHLARLQEQGLVVRRKRHQERPGRPQFTYSLLKGVYGRAVSALLNPYKGLVVISFEKLQHLCRHEKGRYCNEIRERCAPQNCPQIVK